MWTTMLNKFVLVCWTKWTIFIMKMLTISSVFISMWHLRGGCIDTGVSEGGKKWCQSQSKDRPCGWEYTFLAELLEHTHQKSLGWPPQVYMANYVTHVIHVLVYYMGRICVLLIIWYTCIYTSSSTHATHEYNLHLYSICETYVLHVFYTVQFPESMTSWLRRRLVVYYMFLNYVCICIICRTSLCNTHVAHFLA